MVRGTGFEQLSEHARQVGPQLCLVLRIMSCYYAIAVVVACAAIAGVH
jgi:hypothetical protein